MPDERRVLLAIARQRERQAARRRGEGARNAVFSPADTDRNNCVGVGKGVNFRGAGHEASDARNLMFEGRKINDLEGHGVSK
jgi:hypothetical protein